MSRSIIIACFLVGVFCHSAGGAAGTCAGSRACDVTVCWYLSPATRCVRLVSHGYGAGLVTDSDDGTKRIEWAGTYFRGYHILTGPVLIDLDGDRPSKGIVRPTQPGAFFPASTVIEFYFTIRAPNRGWLLKNRAPVRVSCQDIHAIPPRGSVFRLVQPVDFFRAGEMNDPNAKPVIMLREASILFDPPQPLFAFPIWLRILVALVGAPFLLLLTRIGRVMRLLGTGTPADWSLLRRTMIWPGIAFLMFVAGTLWTFRYMSVAQVFAAALGAGAMTLFLYLFRWAARFG